MSKAEKYQRFAEACLEIASAAKDDKIKPALMHMAQVWLRLAANQTKEKKTKPTRLGLVISLSLICEISPTLRHFVENTLMMLISGLIGQSHAQRRKFAILS